MEILVFNFQFYLILLLCFLLGKEFVQKKNISARKYFQKAFILIAIYAFFEGTRWMRGADYKYNYNIANCTVESKDIVYDSFAQILYYMGFPYWIFFILISAFLFISLLYLCKNYKEAFFPCMIFLYAFTMQQSENLMRQYTAISCVLIAYTLFFDNKYKWSVVWIIISYFIHSSVIFIIPFFIFFVSFYHIDASKFRVIKYFPFIFFLLYISSFVIKGFLNDFLQTLNFDDVNIAEKYLSEDYLKRATDDSMASLNVSESLLDRIRSVARAYIIIFSGLLFLKRENKDIFLFVTYSLGCCGLIYIASLPELTMEVFLRLGLYLNIFGWFFEGYIVYYVLYKEGNVMKKSTLFDLFFYYAVWGLVLMEAVWIFKWKTGGIHGLNFIWL